MNSKLSRTVHLLLTLLMACFASMALAVEQTGRLEGVVKDDQGMTLPGATVVISSPNLIGGVRAAITNEDGIYTFYNLPPGEYMAKFSLEGYVTTVISEIRVNISKTAFLTAVLKAGELIEQVTVTAQAPIIDPKSNTTTDNFSNTFIQNIQIGAGARDYQSVFQQSPGVAGSDNPSVRGATLGDNAYLIDGVDTTDPVTSTWGLMFNFDAVEEVQLLTGGLTAEYGRATGGIGNIVTKSGGNEFAGTFDIRYRNENFSQKGEHFDPDKVPSSFFNPAFTFGGPIIKDKVWFFLSYQYTDAESTPSQSPVTYAFNGQNYVGKLTWMINSNNILTFQVTGDPAEIDNDNASAFITKEAASFQKQGAHFASLKYYATLHANWWVEAQAAFYKSILDSYPQDGDFTTEANYIANEGLTTENYPNAQYSERFRNQANVILSYSQPDLVGSHRFKFGLDLQDTEFTFHSFAPGGGYYESLNVAGENYRYFHYVDVPAGETENKGLLLAGFVQDEWEISPRVTANIGFRYDSAQYDNDIGKKVFDLALIQPRLGLSFDTKGDGSNVWKWSYATYMDPSLLGLPWLLNTRANASEIYFVEEYWGDLNGDGDADDEVGDLDGDGTIDIILGGPGGTMVDPQGLDPTFVMEYQFGYERRLTPNQGLRLTWVYRKTDDIIEDVYDESRGVYVIKNLENGRRRYFGVELRYNLRIPRGEIMASYNYGVAKGNIEYTQSAGSDFDFPDLSVNRYGYLSYDRTHAVKINGYLNLPLDFSVAWDAIYHTGEPYNAYLPGMFYGNVFVVARGSSRLPNYYRVDLEGRKKFTIGQTKAQVILSIFNLLDDEIVTEVNEFFDSNSFGQPTNYQQPRRFEIGLRYQF